MAERHTFGRDERARPRIRLRADSDPGDRALLEVVVEGVDVPDLAALGGPHRPLLPPGPLELARVLRRAHPPP